MHGFKDVLPLDMDIERTPLALLLEEADQLIKDAVNQFNRDMPRWKNIDKLEFRSEEFPKTTTLKIRRNYKELEKAGKI